MTELTATQKHQAKMVEEFIKSYMYCALWSSMDNSDEQGGDPFDLNYSIEDFAEETVEIMTKECKAFIEKAESMLDDSDESYDRAGHDFWLTRNHHGAGFWDGDWPKHGDTLTTLSQEFKELYLYLGDDKKIYQEG